MPSDANLPVDTPACRRACYAAALALGLLLGACVSYPEIPIAGYLANKPIETAVDSPLAGSYLETSSNHFPASTKPDKPVAEINRRFGGSPLDSATLRRISQETSPDFATIYFVNRILADGANKAFQARYFGELRRIDSLVQQARWTSIIRTRLREYKFLFIPGFHYLTDKNSGADFANQRQLMRQLGVDAQLVRTEEDGTIEENAEIIARVIRAESRSQAKLVLVSTSKGGPETALALGRILLPVETNSVKAWLSVGGLIRGTPLADRVESWPASWIARIIFSLQRTDFRSVPGLTTAASRARMNGIRLPPSILIVQFVGTPLSGDIAEDVRGRYSYLRKFGPNDGLTLLADELMPGGITVIEPGVDHFYRDPEINLKSLAIANLVADNLNYCAARPARVAMSWTNHCRRN
jgi:hypothetical protein